MESKELKPVSLSTTQGTPVPSQALQPRKPAISSSVLLSTSLPIRAPITIDDSDSDFESNDNKFENTSTGSSLSGGDSGIEYEVFVRGEEFETASESERALVADDPDGETVTESDVVDKYEVFRPFVAYPDEESVENGVEDEEENGEVDENVKLVRPIAQLSWEDDGSDLLGSEVEYEGSLSSVEVNNLEVVEKIRIAPRIKFFEVDEGREEEPMVQTVSLTVNQSESLDFDNFVEAENSFPSVKEEKLYHVEDCVEDVLVEDTSHGGAEVPVESLEDNKRDVVERNSELVADVENEKLGEYDTVRDAQIEDSSDLESLTKGHALQRYNEESHGPMGNNLVENEEPNLLGSNVEKGEAENSLKYDEIPETNMGPEIDFGHAKDKSLTATLDLTDNCSEGYQNEFDFDKHSVTNQAEEIVDSGECDLSETVYENEIEVCDEDTFEEEKNSPAFYEDVKDLVYGSSEITEQNVNELGQRFVAASRLGTKDFEDHSRDLDEGDKDSDSTGEEFADSAISSDLTVDGPADFDSSPHSGKVASRQTHTNTLTPLDLGHGDEFEVNLSEKEKKKIEKMQLLKVKFLRVVHRLGISFEDSRVTQVLDRLDLDFGKQTNHFGTFESTKKMALDFEAENKSNLDFCLNILVLGKSGVGKSATINFIFGEKKAVINAFKPTTTALKEIVGTVDGVKIRILDTPGLKVPAIEQAANQKILATISKYMKKFPPDVVLYVDRLDMQNKDNDLPLLRSISRSLGSSIWNNAVVTLTHAASVPPDASSGLPLSHEVFVAQKYRVVLQSISRDVGNMYLMNPSFMLPLALVENNALLSEGSSGRSQLLLLCHSIKVLSEASCISMLEVPSDWRKVHGFPIHSPPLPYLLSSLLQSRAHPNNAESDTEFADLWDSGSEDEDEYDQLPSFRPLRRSQIAKLSKEQRKNYFEEYDYRVKLLQKKQWKEEIKRLREIKNKGKDASNVSHDFKEDGDLEELNPTSESVPLPDMILPPSFDGDDSAYRYRSLEPSSQLFVRPVMETYCWDHDYGYSGVNIERDFAVSDRFPAAFSFQITKDKKKFNIHLDSSVSMKHTENCSTLAGLDIQTLGKQLAYILRCETKVRNLKVNKTTAGLTVSFVGENLATGFKIEDQIAVGKCLVLAASAGAVQSQGNTAYGANLELRLKEEDFPIGQDQSSFGLSLMKWKGDLALTAALQTQFSIGRNSKMAVHVGLNRKQSGQITIRTSSSDQLQIALVGILPIVVSIFRSICSGLGVQNSTN